VELPIQDLVSSRTESAANGLQPAVATTTAIVFGSSMNAQPPSSGTVQASQDRFDPLPSWLAAPPDRLGLPTERDILASMDIAGSLLTGSRPQANLVPQPKDDVAAIVVFGPVGQVTRMPVCAARSVSAASHWWPRVQVF
jgi:hypothetical protein